MTTFVIDHQLISEALEVTGLKTEQDFTKSKVKSQKSKVLPRG